MAGIQIIPGKVFRYKIKVGPVVLYKNQVRRKAPHAGKGREISLSVQSFF